MRNKIILSSLALLMIAGLTGLEPVFATTTEPLHITQDLYFGIENNEVKSLQTFLTGQGLYNFPSITGYYGLMTEEAVKKLQLQNGLFVGTAQREDGFGYVGPKTRLLLNNLSSSLVTEDFESAQNNNELVAAVGTSSLGASCIQDGITVLHGQSARFYRKSSLPSTWGQSC